MSGKIYQLFGDSQYQEETGLELFLVKSSRMMESFPRRWCASDLFADDNNCTC